jgi:hypothetical protein
MMAVVHTIEKEGVILWKLIIQYNEADTLKITLTENENGSIFSKNKVDCNIQCINQCGVNHARTTKQPWLPLPHEMLVWNGVSSPRTYAAQSSTASTRWM